MRTRTSLAALAFAAAFAVAPSLSAQAVRLPDSLEWTGLPSDPADFPAKIQAGGAVLSLYHGAGCPSDGGYAGAAYDALIEATETDPALRYRVATDHAVRLIPLHLSEDPCPQCGPFCPADLPRFEALLTKWLRQEWEDGLLGADNPELGQTVGVLLLTFLDLAHGTAPATYDLLRSIARDPDVYVEDLLDGFSYNLRGDAARSMVQYRINGGMGEAEAVEAVEADLAGAPPVLYWRPPGYPEGR